MAKLNTLTTKEKEDLNLLDSTISPQGLFGAAFTLNQKCCEE